MTGSDETCKSCNLPLEDVQNTCARCCGVICNMCTQTDNFGNSVCDSCFSTVDEDVSYAEPLSQTEPETLVIDSDSETES